jgi:hypothetical protein
MRLYEVRPRADHHGVDLMSDALRFGSLWYSGPNAVSNATSFAKFFSRSHDAVIRVFDKAVSVIETHEHAGEFKKVVRSGSTLLRERIALLIRAICGSHSKRSLED